MTPGEASRPALWASSAGGLQPPDPRGLRPPVAAERGHGPPAMVWQCKGVWLRFKKSWSKQGAVGKARTGAAGRPRPQAVDGGLVHPTPRRASAGWATRSVVHASASVLAVDKARTGAAGRPRP